MSLRTKLLVSVLPLLAGCTLPIQTATVPVPAEDPTDPVLTRATLSVLGPGGEIYDLGEVSRVGYVGADHAISLNVIAQDRESGIRRVEMYGEFLFWCGSTGIGPEQRWRLRAVNSRPPASVDEPVRITAGADSTFSISDAYEATACTDPPARYQDLRGRLTVTATNFRGGTTSREYAVTIVPSNTGVTSLRDLDR